MNFENLTNLSSEDLEQRRLELVKKKEGSLTTEEYNAYAQEIALTEKAINQM